MFKSVILQFTYQIHDLDRGMPSAGINLQFAYYQMPYSSL